jgi:hypothetical protein
MKQFMLIICFAGLSSAALAQDLPQSSVPQVVLAALQSKFPAVSNAKWKLKDDLYKAEFKIEKRGHDLWIDKSGTIKKHKEDFPKSSLPEGIRERIKKEFAGYNIDDVDRIETEGKVIFQVDLDGTTGDRKVLFSPDGTIQQTKE